MKKILALVLCLIMTFAMFTGCAQSSDDKGATIQLYLSSELYSFDPATAYIDDASAQVLGLLYEGLFRIDGKGNRVNGNCKSYKIVDNDKEHYIQLELIYTCWSDGIQLQAKDYVYAFKRILDPANHNEAAAMLMEITGAAEVKEGGSPDDLGVYDDSMTTLRITFDHTIDYEQFLDNLASPALVPLRENVVGKVDSDWATNSTIVTTNAAFMIRGFEPGESLTLERNQYYKRDIEEDGIMKYVTPYRLEINFGSSAQDNFQAFLDGTLYYDSEIPLASRTQYKDQIKTNDTMSEMSVMFNVNNELLKDAEVRRALSIALDRQHIADLLVYAKPATGIITQGVYETNRKDKTMFADVSGTLISSSADMATAQSLLSGKSKGTITVTYRNNEVDAAVFEYIKSVWEELGYTVEGRSDLTYTEYHDSVKEYDLLHDDYVDAYQAGDFEVILLDYQMLSTNAFANLASFALKYAGGAMDVENNDFTLTPHICGYNSEAYNTLIDNAFAATDSAARATILHDAEKMLIQDAPIAPLVVYQRAYVISDELSGYQNLGMGMSSFTKVKLKSYKFVEETQAA